MDRRIKKISLFVVMAMMGCCRMSAQQVNAPLLAFKMTPFGVQKDSFWSVKGLLLSCKRTPFGMQKDSFLNVEC